MGDATITGYEDLHGPIVSGSRHVRGRPPNTSRHVLILHALHEEDLRQMLAGESTFDRLLVQPSTLSPDELRQKYAKEARNDRLLLDAATRAAYSGELTASRRDKVKHGLLDDAYSTHLATGAAILQGALEAFLKRRSGDAMNLVVKTTVIGSERRHDRVSSQEQYVVALGQAQRVAEHFGRLIEAAKRG